MKIKTTLFFYISTVILIVSCGIEDENYYPKPLSGMKLVFPDKKYVAFENNCGVSFEIPVYAEADSLEKTCNNNFLFKDFDATLFLTYANVDTNLNTHIEYSRKLVYDHSIKADAIEEHVVKDNGNKTYGVKYNIVGNAASPFQFYVTDSVNHFMRGALYFNVAPNYDSLKPSLEFLIKDFDYMIESINWKK